MSRADCDACDDAKDAEICILKTEACAAQKNIKRRDDDIAGLMKELARWQGIAIEAHATIEYYESNGIFHILGWRVIEKERQDHYRERAASELSRQTDHDDVDLTTAYMLGGKNADERLKVLQEYVSRLEADYLSWVQTYFRDLGEEVAMQRAQDALEKIRKCHP